VDAHVTIGALCDLRVTGCHVSLGSSGTGPTPRAARCARCRGRCNATPVETTGTP